MAWVRIDDQAPRHHKMLKAGPAACWLWVCGNAHCQSQLTDGFISDAVLPMIGVAKGCKEFALTLVNAHLWDRAEGGYLVHDYLHYNPSRAQVLAKRAEDSERKRAAESKRNPNGIRVESEAPRASVPSHPIPSHPGDATASPRPHARNGSGVLAGAYPRDHRDHAVCDPGFAWCVPAAVHARLVNDLSPKYAGDRVAAANALKAWYPKVWATLPADFTMGDKFKFWQPRFDAEFASADAATAKKRAPEPASTVPSADETRKRYLTDDGR